ncbi:MAG: hypothetical protein ACRDCW_06770 [Sarcina sp.]
MSKNMFLAIATMVVLIALVQMALGLTTDNEYALFASGVFLLIGKVLLVFEKKIVDKTK